MEFVIFGVIFLALALFGAYYMDGAIYNYVDQELNEEYTLRDDLFAYTASDIAELEDQILALEALVQSFQPQRPAGVYDQNGMLIFASPEEVIDAAITQDLDGTLDDES